MNRKIMFVIVLVLITVGFLSGCIDERRNYERIWNVEILDVHYDQRVVPRPLFGSDVHDVTILTTNVSVIILSDFYDVPYGNVTICVEPSYVGEWSLLWVIEG